MDTLQHCALQLIQITISVIISRLVDILLNNKKIITYIRKIRTIFFSNFYQLGSKLSRVIMLITQKYRTYFTTWADKTKIK